MRNANIKNNDIRNLSASGDASALLVGDNESNAGVSSGVFYFNWRMTPDHLAPCNGSSTPITEGDCKAGGWITHVRPDGSVFKSQGDCIQFVNNGR